MIAATSRPAEKQKQTLSTHHCFRRPRGAFVLVIFRLTGFGCELQAVWAELRLGDGLQESGVLSGGELGRQLADVARHEVGLLVADQEGDVRLEHVHAHLVLREEQVSRASETLFNIYSDVW